MVEKRKSARQKTLLGAQITTEALAGWSAEGTVKNIGRGGARIVLSPRASIPDTFRLDITKRASTSARLVWHHEGVVGVAFDKAKSDETDAASSGERSRGGSSDARPSKDDVLEARIAAIVGGRCPQAASVARKDRRAASQIETLGGTR